ncbi:unnamed protein product [Leuciscus chuanchicus]
MQAMRGPTLLLPPLPHPDQQSVITQRIITSLDCRTPVTGTSSTLEERKKEREGEPLKKDNRGTKTRQTTARREENNK